jgi:uncharacterized membrane protein HdeD (DUF308 family)
VVLATSFLRKTSPGQPATSIGPTCFKIYRIINEVPTVVMVSMLFFGWLLALASGIEVVQAIMVGHWAGFFHHLVAAVLFGVTGFLLVTRPVLSAEVLTMLMAVFFLVSGLFQFIGSIWVALPGWGWQAVDGIIAIVLDRFQAAPGHQNQRSFPI